MNAKNVSSNLINSPKFILDFRLPILDWQIAVVFSPKSKIQNRIGIEAQRLCVRLSIGKVRVRFPSVPPQFLIYAEENIKFENYFEGGQINEVMKI